MCLFTNSSRNGIMRPYFRMRRLKQLLTFCLGTGLTLLIFTYLFSNPDRRPQLKDSLCSKMIAKLTNPDLKKTVSILLESILSRIDSLEKVILGRSASNDISIKDRVSALDLLSGKQENCSIPEHLISQYPNCNPKLEWMSTYWQSDPCYAKHGVDGSQCSFYVYLSEVEVHCPALPWRSFAHSSIKPPTAIVRTTLPPLFNLMNDNPNNFLWIKARLTQMWSHWMEAVTQLRLNQNWTLVNRPKKRILLHLGLLTRETNFKFGEKSLKGGPLGELVQWTDLIASLYILGHDLFISSESRTFISFAQADPGLKSSCPEKRLSHVDLIYTDIVGLKQMKKKIAASVRVYKCRIRVLDSFGTEAEFNDQSYFTKNQQKLGGKMKNYWGGHTLNLQQFYTMYPHSPDNTFLGFVVKTFEMNKTDETGYRKDWALVYGKESYMWKGSEAYISKVNEILPVHSTVSSREQIHLPKFVVNHGVLSGPDFHNLLQKVKVFIGLGFPYEGPAALEAIANGAIFLNPLFVPPIGRRTDKFFAEKPTLRALSSQNPYVEQFIGPPYVLSVDISNLTAVEQTLKAAKNSVVQPFLPYEFTCSGMLQRVNAFVEHQDFCRPSNNWPPFSACQIVASKIGESCKSTCAVKDLICEPSFFPKINNAATIGDNLKCKVVSGSDSVTSPSYALSSCFIQENVLRFSCSSFKPDEIRLCPCRDFVKDQAALCTACL